MTIYILTLIVVVLFVVGISLLYKGSGPAVDPKEIKSLNDELAAAQKSREQVKAELDSVKKEFDQAKPVLESAQKLQEEVTALKAGEAKFIAQVKDMEEQLTRIYMKADDQAKEAIEVINALRKDNEALKAQPPVAAAASPQLEIENAELKKQLQEIQAKVTQLQNELSAAPAAQAPAAPAADPAEVESLKATNVKLTEQITALTAQLQDSPQEKAELDQLKQEMEKLKGESQNLQQQSAKAQELQASCDDFKKQLDEMREIVKQQEQKLVSGAGSEQQLMKLKEVNEFLARKEKFLQAELTKSRIKAVGLEKICDALKSQLESLTKAASAG